MVIQSDCTFPSGMYESFSCLYLCNSVINFYMLTVLVSSGISLWCQYIFPDCGFEHLLMYLLAIFWMIFKYCFSYIIQVYILAGSAITKATYFSKSEDGKKVKDVPRGKNI